MKRKNMTRTALVTSIIALMLCVSMLVGATFAWFTDSVVSAGNKIQSGTLDIELYELTSDGWNDISKSNKALFDYDLWEPGYTDVTVLKVENKGTLALKWAAYVTPVSAETVSILADVIDVYVLEGAIAAPASFAEVKSNYVRVGTLKEFMAGFATNTVGTLEAGEFATLGVALHMQEEAGNEYQGLALGSEFDIRIVATQETFEKDSFDDLYDADAAYPTVVANAAELKAALAAGGNVKLDANVKLDKNDTITVAAGQDVTLDLNGHTITTTASNSATHVDAILVKGNLTVKNGTVDGKFVGENMGWNGGYNVFDVTAGGVLNLENVIVNASGTDMNFCVHLNNWGEVTLNANNCKFNSTYCGVRVFNSGFDMNNITIKNSTLTGATRAFWVHNYIGDLDSSQHSDEAINARLNLNIYNNNNTFSVTGTPTSPIRYGFNTTVYYNADGTVCA